MSSSAALASAARLSDRAFERTLTELDHVRLEHLIRRTEASGGTVAVPLEALMDTAEIVPSRSVAADVVTVNSRVQVADPASGESHELTVCWPADADVATGRVSVLSPVGAGLLGQRAGGVARWSAPDGAAHLVDVVAVLYQPEASGDYTG